MEPDGRHDRLTLMRNSELSVRDLLQSITRVIITLKIYLFGGFIKTALLSMVSRNY